MAEAKTAFNGGHMYFNGNTRGSVPSLGYFNLRFSFSARTWFYLFVFMIFVLCCFNKRWYTMVHAEGEVFPNLGLFEAARVAGINKHLAKPHCYCLNYEATRVEIESLTF